MSWNNMWWTYPNNAPPHPPHPPPQGSGASWDWVRSNEQYTNEPGHGVDHTDQPASGPGAPFEGVGGPGGFWGGPRGPWGRRGRWGPPGEGFGPWGGRRHGSCRGRRCHRDGPPGDEEPPSSGDEVMYDAAAAMKEGAAERDPEKQDTPGTLRDNNDNDDNDGEHPDPPEEVPGPPPHGRCRGGRRGGCGPGRRGGPHGRGGWHGHHHGPHHGPHHGHRGEPSQPPPPPPYSGGPPFDFRAMMASVANLPAVREAMNRWQQATGAGPSGRDGNDNNNNDGGDSSFSPPVDVFDGEDAWTVHVALPGAKKEDVAVAWDAERSSLAVSGVVHRPGDEIFLQSLVGGGERRVGFFERSVRIPPLATVPQRREGEKELEEQVDAEGIAARMEDGILVVVVPKVEREWTEVRKVDIE